MADRIGFVGLGNIGKPMAISVDLPDPPNPICPIIGVQSTIICRGALLDVLHYDRYIGQ